MKSITSWRERLLVIAFLSPALGLVGLFTIWPAIWAVIQSFSNRALIGEGALNPRFIGFTNYRSLLHDPAFFASIERSAEFVFFSAIVGQTLLGFLIAYLLATRPRWRLRFRGAFAALFLLPLAVPETVAALAWAAMADGTKNGLLNRFIGLFGFGPVQWLQNDAMLTLIVINIWRGVPFAMVLLGAALASTPEETLEAAMVDGASSWQQLRRVTLPMIRPQILLFLLLTTITTFGIFGLVYFLTKGGPGDATTIVGIYIYKQAFQFYEIGYGSAAGVIMLLILLALGVGYVRLMREQV
jgi:multiple sugar transport system permease protein